MPKNSAPRKKYKPKAVFQPGLSKRQFADIVDDILTLEGKMYAHLHDGTASVHDVYRVHKCLVATQFIVLFREDLFPEDQLGEWFEQFHSAGKALVSVINRGAKGGRVVCTGDELTAILDICSVIFPFLKSELEAAPKSTSICFLASQAMYADSTECAAKTGKRSFCADRREVKRYYERTVSEMLNGTMVKRAIKNLTGESIKTEEIPSLINNLSNDVTSTMLI